MQEIEPDLDLKRAKAIVHLLQEPTIESAAAAAGVDPSTIYRWLKEPDFSAAYRQAKRNLFDHSMTQILNATAEAAQTLRDIMTDSTAPEAARVSAAKTVLTFARENLNLQNLEERLDEIEAALKKVGESS